jgi:hypothetical protein
MHLSQVPSPAARSVTSKRLDPGIKISVRELKLGMIACYLCDPETPYLNPDFRAVLIID